MQRLFQEPPAEIKFLAFKVLYVAARSIKVPFGKGVIESTADFDAYLEAQKTAYAAELAANKRITL